MRRSAVVLSFVLASCGSTQYAQPNFGTLEQDERPFTFRHNIDLIEVNNGLRVALIHEDRTNLATIDVRYDVGAAEDPVGRAGLAHLVEHLMFELRSAAGAPTLGEELGELALYHNASTSWDYTHYTTMVPIEHLPDAISLEARRMAAPCEQLDDATFEREREVVRAEGRESSSPLTDVMLDILKEMYGPAHPYTRAITSDEIAVATRDEACAFIKKHYTPDRAYVVITGPFDPSKIRGQVGRAFGLISSQSTAPREPMPGPKLEGRTTRRTAPIARPTALVFLTHPAWGADGSVKFSVGRRGLAEGLEAADDEHDWITGTAVWVAGGWRAPVMVAQVEVKKKSQLRKAANEVFARADKLLDGTTMNEFSASLGEMTMRYVESWDNLPGRGEWIADFMQFTDHNWFMLKEMRAISDTNWGVAITQLRGTLNRERSHVVLLEPGAGTQRARAAAVPSGSHKLTPWRAPVDPADADKPVEIAGTAEVTDVLEYTLGNGLRVQLAADPDSPIVDARLVFPVGSAHEPPDRPFVATAAARLLVPAVGRKFTLDTFLKLDWAMSHGTEVRSQVGEVATVFTARGLAHWGDWHVWYLSFMFDQGGYSQDVIDVLHAAARARGDDEDSEIDPVAKTFLSRLFGAGHPYAMPEPGRAAAFLKIEKRDLEKWRDDHFRLRGATLVISGAFEVADMKREIDELFGPMPDVQPKALPMIPAVHPSRGPSWLAVEDEHAVQTGIIVGFTAASPPGEDEAEHAVIEEMIDDSLRDIREGMGASYGFDASYLFGPAGGVLVVRGEVDEGKADVVLAHILGSLERIRAGGDDQRAAFVRARKKVLALALGRSGGATAIAGQLAAHAAGGYSKSHGSILASRIAGLTLADVTQVAAADLGDVHRVVLVRGKKASVDAAYAAIATTPERIAPPPEKSPSHDAEDDDEDEDDAEEEDDDEDEGASSGKVADSKPHRDEGGPRLSVGAPDGELGSTRLGLYLGSQKLTLDEFLHIAGADDVASRMKTRRWARRGMMAAGAIGGAVALFMTLTTEDCRTGDGIREYAECQDRVSDRKTAATVTFGISAIVAASGSTIGSGAPTNDELRRIAARYNQVSVSPAVSPKGAGFVISGRF